jgi:hypothetical protein
VVFSVGEAEANELYQRAADQAWVNIEERVRQLSASVPSKKLRLIQVQYEPSMDQQSLIDELPEQPKSSRPQAVEVRVRLRATYELR